jgi:hypothetical protein
VRYEFGPSLRTVDSLVGWAGAFAGTVMLRPASCADDVGDGFVGPSLACILIRRQSSMREDCEPKEAIDLPDVGRRRVPNRDIGAMQRRLNRDESRHALFSG